MLVLVSFGLVLLATILLVVGLLNDDGLTLIYFSIAASATAAVVLYMAFRMARPKDESSADAPPPLEDEDLSAVVADTTTVSPAVMEETPAAPEPAAAPPPPAPPVAEAGPDTGDADDQWADDADWEVDDDEVAFPIADYDDLSVAEIMPLLPQLYSDELDVVYEREQSTKNRSTILARLDKLKETGTEADASEDVDVDDEMTEIEVADDPSQTIVAPAPAPPPPAPAPVSLLDDDDDDAAFFPIADYDDLSVSQIVPLLSQLETDELEDVKAREQAGANRTTLLTEIDRYLSGELEAFSWEDEDAAEPAGVTQPVRSAPTPADSPAAERDRLPIAGYDDLNVADIRPQLGDLSPAELEQVLEYERARDNRSTIVNDITRRLESAPAPAAAAPKRAAKRGTTKKAATRTAPAKRSTAKKATTKRTTAKKAAKSARKATKKAAASRFPIANYDELNVSDIRPRLAKLSDDQLRQVREREATGAGRKTILNDIDGRLS